MNRNGPHKAKLARRRRFGLTSLAVAGVIAGLSQTALASDLPARMPAKAPYISPVSVYNWTGFYVGGHIGGAWSDANLSDPTGVNFAPTGATIGDHGSGFLGGAQVGFNWQTGNWVFGVQGDMSWTGINAGVIDPFVTTTTLNYKSDWLATVTGRVGYAWNNWLLYGKGGAAWVHNKYSATDPVFAINATGNDTRAGWVAGGGVEYGITPNWTTFIEYDYIGLGTHTVTLSDPTFGAVPVGIHQNIQIVKAGINYRFGGL
jgi:outer membrane immunogenic protein